jgi:hypothetical protein
MDETKRGEGSRSGEPLAHKALTSSASPRAAVGIAASRRRSSLTIGFRCHEADRLDREHQPVLSSLQYAEANGD